MALSDIRKATPGSTQFEDLDCVSGVYCGAPTTP